MVHVCVPLAIWAAVWIPSTHPHCSAGLDVLPSSGPPVVSVLSWAFSTAGEPSTHSGIFWPETGLADWLLSVSVLSPEIPPISLGFVSKIGDLCYKVENYSVLIV